MATKKTKTELMIEVLVSELDKLKGTTKQIESVTSEFKKDIKTIQNDFKDELKEIKAEPLKVDKIALNNLISTIENIKEDINKGFIFPKWMIYLGILMFIILSIFSCLGAYFIYYIWIK